MAKGDDKKNYQAAQDNARTQTGNVQSGYNNFNTGIAARMPADRAEADDTRAYLTQQYKNVAEGQGRDYLRSITGGPPFTNGDGSSSSGGSGGSGGGGGGQGVASDPWATPRSGFNEFAATGGVNYGAMTEALGGFRDLSNNGGFTDQNNANLARISQGFRDISDRPWDRTGIDSSINTLRDASSTGGYDPSRLAQIHRDVDNLRNFESISPERLAELRGNTGRLTNLDTSYQRNDIDRLRQLDTEGFGEFARTGGYSEGDIRNIRARAGSAIPSFYSGVKDEIGRRNAISGGYSPGYSASMRAITRDQARGAADANRDTEIGIQDSVRQGRQFGLTGQANARAEAGRLSGALLDQERQGLEAGTRLGQELDLGLAGNRLRGIEGAAEIGSKLEADIANNRIRSAESGGRLNLDANRAEADTRLSALTGQRQTELDPISLKNSARLAALTGITDTAQGAERTVQAGRQFGISGQMGIAQAEEQARQAAAARAAAASAASQGYDLQRAQLASQNERFAMEMGLNGLSGLSDLYRSAPGQVGMYNDDYLGGLSGLNDSIGTGVLAQSPMPKQGGFNWSNMASTGLSMLPGLFGGGGGKRDGGNMSSFIGASDEYGRPLEPMYNDNYFGSPTYPNVTTEESYGDPTNPGNVPGGVFDPSIPVPGSYYGSGWTRGYTAADIVDRGY